MFVILTAVIFRGISRLDGTACYLFPVESSLRQASGTRQSQTRRGAAIEFQFMAKLMYLPATFDCLLNASSSRESLSHFSEKWSHSPVYGVTRSNASGIRQTRVLLVTIYLNSMTLVHCNWFIEHTRRELNCALHFNGSCLSYVSQCRL